MYFGADYYPEQWETARWEDDLRRMKQLGFTMIRIAEFAWCRLEPRPGQFDFKWVDQVLALCRKFDLKVMMGVPVRNVPAWLHAMDPEMAIVDRDGHRESYGSRYTTCLNNPILREHALRLSRQMAEAYSVQEDVVSWHLDNEYGDASICYCDNCRSQFIKWLQKRYVTIENVNKSWGLVFWSLEVNDWNQIWVPAKGNHFAQNPGLLQDYRRFTSDTTIDFVREQAAVFREHAPGKTITTNYQSMTRYHTDYHELARYLDVVSTNYYPRGSYHAVDFDIMRGAKNQNFWVVEQKSGPPGFLHNGFLNPDPGETRMYTYQAIAHGADMVLYFRYRPALFGQEQLHMGIVNYDGSTNRIADEIAKVGREWVKIWEAAAGTVVKNEVALLMSYDNRWALESFYPHPNWEYREYFLRFHEALTKAHIPVDVIHPKQDLCPYKAVIVPLLYMMDAAMVENLRRYVQEGGTVIYTARSGAKDARSWMVPATLPPGAIEMLGIEIEESMALDPSEYSAISFDDDISYPASIWVDRVRPVTAAVLARYTDNWYAGSAAITRNQYGKGCAIYIGTLPGGGFYDDFLKKVCSDAGVRPLMEAPEDIEVCRRVGEDKEVFFLLNRSRETRRINLDRQYCDLLQGALAKESLELAPYDVAVLTPV